MASSSQVLAKKAHVIVHDNFDYERIKQAYLQEIDYVLFKFKLNGKIIVNKSDVPRAISKIKDAKGGFVVHAGKRYYAAIENGNNILCDATWSSNKASNKLISFKQELSVQEMFDVIAELHICQPTLSIDEFCNKLSNCHIPRCFIKLVERVCTCRKHLKQSYKIVCEMGIVDMLSPSKHQRIFMYIDRNTNFILLKPLKTDEPDEVANELLSIFCDFGFPQFVDCKLRPYFEEVMYILKFLPLQDVLPSMYTHNQGHKITFMESKVRNMINDWMVKSKSTNWEMGAHIVQWMMNTNKVENMYMRSKIVKGPIESPYHAMFGMKPHTDKVQFHCYGSIPEGTNNLPLCSHCHQHVHKVYECHFCHAICHFMCCRRVVEDTMEMPIIINKCFSCDNKTSGEYILGS